MAGAEGAVEHQHRVAVRCRDEGGGEPGACFAAPDQFGRWGQEGCADRQRPRKYYRLTGEGVEVARLELAQVSAGRQRAPVRPGRPAPGSVG